MAPQWKYWGGGQTYRFAPPPIISITWKCYISNAKIHIKSTILHYKTIKCYIKHTKTNTIFSFAAHLARKCYIATLRENFAIFLTLASTPPPPPFRKTDRRPWCNSPISRTWVPLNISRLHQQLHMCIWVFWCGVLFIDIESFKINQSSIIINTFSLGSTQCYLYAIVSVIIRTCLKLYNEYKFLQDWIYHGPVILIFGWYLFGLDLHLCYLDDPAQMM